MTETSRLIVLITGANTGIGYHTAVHLARTNKYTILIGARSQEKAQSAVDSIVHDNIDIHAEILFPLPMDITNDSSIAAAAAQVKEKYGRLDILVNNAGIATVPTSSSGNHATSSLRDRFNTIFNTNVSGTACVTEAFMPLLLRSTAPAPARRIVNVGTGLGSLSLIKDRKKPAEPQYVEYGVSKAALNMLSLYTLSRLEKDRVAVVVASPGFCATNLNEGKGIDTPVNGGRYVADAVELGTFLEVNGKFYDKGVEIPW